MALEAALAELMLDDYDEQTFDDYNASIRFTTALSMFTDLDHYPEEVPLDNSDLYMAKIFYINEFKKNDRWKDIKKHLESVAYSTVEVRKSATTLHDMVETIRKMQKMAEDKSGSSIVFLLRLLAKYPLNDFRVEALVNTEFGFKVPSHMIYQANRAVQNILDNLPCEEAEILRNKEKGLMEKPFEPEIKFVPSTPYVIDKKSLSFLKDLYTDKP